MNEYAIDWRALEDALANLPDDVPDSARRKMVVHRAHTFSVTPDRKEDPRDEREIAADLDAPVDPMQVLTLEQQVAMQGG